LKLNTLPELVQTLCFFSFLQELNSESDFIISKSMMEHIYHHSTSEEFDGHCKQANTASSVFLHVVGHSGGRVQHHNGFVKYEEMIYQEGGVDDDVLMVSLKESGNNVEMFGRRAMEKVYKALNNPEELTSNQATTDQEDQSAVLGDRESMETNPCSDIIRSQQQKLLDIYSQLLENVTNVAIIGYPDHSNKGDSAIWVGERILLQQLGIQVSYTCAKSKDCRKEMIVGSLGEPCAHNAILLHGGGNFGDLYPHHQEVRNKIISQFSDYKIIGFPQTVDFSSMDETQYEFLRNVKDVYSKHKDLTLVARDLASFEKLKKVFGEWNRVFLAPDAAFMIGARPKVDVTNQGVRSGSKKWKSVDVLVHQRTDSEGSETQRQLSVWEPLREYLGVHGSDTESVGSFALDDWIYWDVGVYKGLEWDEKALRRLEAGFTFLSQGKTVITNRLHGMLSFSLTICIFYTRKPWRKLM
jgi:exopolysaccharide biosynthesis predicted pyruvyltransferase EpsI